MDKQSLLDIHRELMELRTRHFRTSIPDNGTIASSIYRSITTAIQVVTCELRILDIRQRNYDLFPADKVDKC